MVTDSYLQYLNLVRLKIYCLFHYYDRKGIELFLKTSAIPFRPYRNESDKRFLRRVKINLNGIATDVAHIFRVPKPDLTIASLIR